MPRKIPDRSGWLGVAAITAIDLPDKSVEAFERILKRKVKCRFLTNLASVLAQYVARLKQEELGPSRASQRKALRKFCVSANRLLGIVRNLRADLKPKLAGYTRRRSSSINLTGEVGFDALRADTLTVRILWHAIQDAELAAKENPLLGKSHRRQLELLGTSVEEFARAIEFLDSNSEGLLLDQYWRAPRQKKHHESSGPLFDCLRAIRRLRAAAERAAVALSNQKGPDRRKSTDLLIEDLVRLYEAESGRSFTHNQLLGDNTFPIESTSQGDRFVMVCLSTAHEILNEELKQRRDRIKADPQRPLNLYDLDEVETGLRFMDVRKSALKHPSRGSINIYLRKLIMRRRRNSRSGTNSSSKAHA